MDKFGMPGKLVCLIKKTLEGTRSKVRVEGELTEEFDVQRELRQEDMLSTILFTLALEKTAYNLRDHDI